MSRKPSSSMKSDDIGGAIIVRNTILAAGFVQVPILVLKDPDLSFGAKLCYGALLWYHYKGTGWPGQRTAAAEFGCSVRSMCSYLQELVTASYVIVTRHGVMKPNTYELVDLPVQTLKCKNCTSRSASTLKCKNCTSRHADTALQDTQDLQFYKEVQQEVKELYTTTTTNDRQSPESPPEETTVVVPLVSKHPGTEPLVSELIELGVSPSVANKLARQFDARHISRWIGYTHHRLADGWEPDESVAAYIVAAIRSEDWVIPESFRTSDEQAAEATSRREEQERLAQVVAEEADRERKREAERQAAVARELGVGERERRWWDDAKALLNERRQGSGALSSAYLVSLSHGKAVITTPVELFRTTLEGRAEYIREALAEVSGKQVSAVVVEAREVETFVEKPAAGRYDIDPGGGEAAVA
jgi:hypothetical protein